MTHLVSDARGVLVRCPSCGKTARLRYRDLGRAHACGHCHQSLSPPGIPVDASDAAVFGALLAEIPVPVLVDFWAPWCGPCRMMAPELEKVARAVAGDALVVKVNTEEAPDLGQRFGIRSIPTIVVFKDGQEVARRSGAMPASEIQALMSGLARR